MPFYRWEGYQSTNLGHHQSADAGQIIDLPCDAEPFCPTHGKPVSPLGARAIEPVSPPASARLPTGKRPLRLLVLVSGALVAPALAGIVWLLSCPPERLYLEVPKQVSARGGDPLQIPLTVEPASAANLALSAEGALPEGVALDAAGRRLYGTAQSAGFFPIIITARAPGYASASAKMSIIIRPNRAAAALSLQVAGEVEGRVGQALEVPVTTEPLTNPEPSLTVVASYRRACRWMRPENGSWAPRASPVRMRW